MERIAFLGDSRSAIWLKMPGSDGAAGLISGQLAAQQRLQGRTLGWTLSGS